MKDLRQELQEKYDVIQSKINEIEMLRNQSFKTSCKFRYNPSNSYSSLDIDTTMNISELIHANAFIQFKNEQYVESAKHLGLNEFPVFKWCGYEPELWFHDIKLRLQLVNMDKELSKLKELRAKIQPYLPEDNKIKQLLLELQ